jgi:hypothetical protein
MDTAIIASTVLARRPVDEERLMGNFKPLIRMKQKLWRVQIQDLSLFAMLLPWRSDAHFSCLGAWQPRHRTWREDFDAFGRRESPGELQVVDQELKTFKCTKGL